MEKSRRTSRSSAARLRWVAIGLAVAAVLTVVSFVRESVRNRQIDLQIASLKEEADRLQARNFETLSLHDSLGQSEFLEKEARTKLNLQKERERVVVLRKPDEAAPAGTETAFAGEDWSDAKKWWMYFADRQNYDAYAAEKTGSR